MKKSKDQEQLKQGETQILGMKGQLGDLLQRWGVLIGLLILVLIFSIYSRHFFTMPNLLNIARQTSINAIIAVGMTYIIITCGIDLSVGSTVGLTAVTMGVAMTNYGIPPFFAMLLALLVGGIIGLINGVSVAHVKIPPFIITLAMMTIVRGIAFVITGGYPVYIDSDFTRFIGRGFFLGIPTPVYFFAVIYILGALFLAKTKYGRYIYAVGGNMQTAQYAGINVKRILVGVYVFTGVLAAISGVLLASRLASGPPNVGTGMELDVIAASILGGASFAGGEGTIGGTLVGALLMGVLNNGMNLLNINPYTQMIVQGLVIFGAVYISVLSSRKKD